MSRSAWLAVIGISFAYLITIGSRGLNEPDEGRYAEIGREMAVSGDWLIPRLNGIEHFQKPPLIYWATAASIKIFGPHDWAVRLPSALAALLLIAATAWLGRELKDRDTGWLAGMIAASTFGVYLLGHLLTPDMLMAMCITVALAAMARFYRTKHKFFGYLVFLAAGLAFMTKGPMGFVVPAAAGIGMTIAVRRSGGRLGLPWVTGCVLALALGLAWFFAVVASYPELKEYFLVDEFIQRVVSKKHGRWRPFWYFLVILPLFMMPWTALALGLWRRTWRRLWSKDRLLPELALLFAAVAIPFIVLSASGSKLPTYILPLAGPLAVAIAWHIRTTTAFKPSTVRRVAIGALGFAFVAMLAADRFQPYLGRQASVKSLASIARTRPDFDRAKLFACDVRADGWEFYLGRLVHATEDKSNIIVPLRPEQKKRMHDGASALEEFMRAKPLAYGILRQGTYKKFFEPNGWRIFGRSGDFLLVGSPGSWRRDPAVVSIRTNSTG
ncbi:MAG: glycosyltransferase family 39 protein [Kiritimatiellia bacterium]|nr:glycosyltransferase family 39 protein [Kiritimatiellia bacterium]